MPFIELSAGASSNSVQQLAWTDSSQASTTDGHPMLKRFKDENFEIQPSLYDAISVETLSEMSDSDHIIERINDPLMNFYATASTERSFKIGPSVSSETLDDNLSALGVPETPTDSSLVLSASPLPVQNLSFSDMHSSRVNQESECDSWDKTSKSCEGDADSSDKIALAIRQKVISRVKDRDSKASGHLQKFDLPGIFLEDDLILDRNRNFEAPSTNKMNSVLDLILNNDDLEIHSVQTDSGIGSQITQNAKSKNLLKAENSAIQSSLLVNRNYRENLPGDHSGFVNDLRLDSGNKLERLTHSTEVSSVTLSALSSSLPLTTQTQKGIKDIEFC